MPEQPSLLPDKDDRVIECDDNPPPTCPREVTMATPLEHLNLNWTEKDLPERERTRHVHRLHPYLGKFIPQIAEIFLRRYFRAGETVYDPFCGSGTTLVEANALGIKAVGCDIAAFNCLLSRAKTQAYDIALMRKEVLDILSRTGRRGPRLFLDVDSSSPGQFVWEDDFKDTDNEYLRMWYAVRARRELLMYQSMISNYHYQDLLRVILSRAARSARLATHFDLDFPTAPQTGPYYCHKHSRMCHPPQRALGFLKRYSLDAIHRIRQYSHLRTKAESIVIWDDSRRVSLPCPVDGVITSPPYVGLIDYHDQHRYAYELLGLPVRREEELGAAFKGRSRSAGQVYKQGIIEVFTNAGKYLKRGGRLIVIVHDQDGLYTDIAGQCGFEIEGMVQRHVNRRTGRRSHEFFEDILVWRKQ